MSWAALHRDNLKRYQNLTAGQLCKLIAEGQLGPDDLVRKSDETNWQPIAAVPQLAQALPRFTFKRPKRPDTSEEIMDMTPMIDVVFQLLLFFMIISTFQLQKSIDVPQTNEEQQAEEAPTLGQLGRDMVVVTIGPDNSIEFLFFGPSGRETGRERVDKEQLVDKFAQVAVEERKSSVLIDAVDRADIDTVVAVIDAANQAQLAEVRIAKRVRRKPDRRAVREEPASR